MPETKTTTDATTKAEESTEESSTTGPETKTTTDATTKGTVSTASNAAHDGPEYVHYSGESDQSYGLTEAAFADDGRSFRSNITGEWYPKQ